MAEKDTIYNSKIKSTGVFSFKDFYVFCYKWLTEDVGLTILENKYSEKITGDSKNIEVKWTGTRDITDYFQFEMEVVFDVKGLSKIEISEKGKKIETNKGSVEVKVKGTLVRDYKGKFEATGFNKFLRGIYEKWVITSRINELKGKIKNDCDEFLSQGKAYLDLEGKRE
ncbi:hypothetical protein HY448_02635 [Candidatus Pacearchaeota archaeon]|nr:hypothetical protein [Candidatus Pacearchaeota archaeon]